MEYKAKINNVNKTNDEILIMVEFFSVGEEPEDTVSFEKNYNFVSSVDIEAHFEQLVKNELNRINGLEDSFLILKDKIGQEIV